MFRSCQIIIRKFCSLLKLYYDILSGIFLYQRNFFWPLSGRGANKMGWEWRKAFMCIKDWFKPVFPIFLTWYLDLTPNNRGRFCPSLVPRPSSPVPATVLLAKLRLCRWLNVGEISRGSSLPSHWQAVLGFSSIHPPQGIFYTKK